MTMFRFTILLVSICLVPPVFAEIGPLGLPIPPPKPGHVNCLVTDSEMGTIECNKTQWYVLDGESKVYIKGVDKKLLSIEKRDIRGKYCDLLMRKNRTDVDTARCS